MGMDSTGQCKPLQLDYKTEDPKGKGEDGERILD